MDSIVEEIKNIKVEFEFTARWSIVDMYHQIGELLVSQPDTDLKELSPLVEISERNLYRSVQFYKAYPDINMLPEGKNVSWHIIANKLLPAPRTKDETPCIHDPITICSKCKAKLGS
jgi:hypothetical protein